MIKYVTLIFFSYILLESYQLFFTFQALITANKTKELFYFTIKFIFYLSKYKLRLIYLNMNQLFFTSDNL